MAITIACADAPPPEVFVVGLPLPLLDRAVRSYRFESEPGHGTTHMLKGTDLYRATQYLAVKVAESKGHEG
jgi:hypothetical protein